MTHALALEQRINKTTGGLVSLHKLTDDSPDPWITFCHLHDVTCRHRSRPIARSYLGAPGDWCEECGKILYGVEEIKEE